MGMTIQRAFKRYKKRKLMNEEGLPDLKCAQVQEATLKIQSAYRGFRTRQDVKSKKNNTADAMFAAIRIQRAFKKYKARKHRREIEEGLPDLNSSEVKGAAVKIQSVYRGFQTRRVGRKKVAKSSSDSSESDEESKTKRRASSDFSESESEDEFKKPPRPSTVRRPPKAKARPLKSRKIPDSSATESQSELGESLPDLDDSDVEDAALKIQSAFRGFQARKNVSTLKKTPKMGDVMHSVITIQRSFRRYKQRKQERKKAAMILQKEKLAKESEKISSKGTRPKPPRPQMAKVAHSAIIIQRAFRRWKWKRLEGKLRRSSKVRNGGPPSSSFADVVQSALTIQRAYR